MARRVFQKPNSKQFKKLRQQLNRASNEEEVRLAWVRALEATLGIAFDAERGKRDLSYNNVIIEFKGPGKFNGKIASPVFQEAIHERLLPYISRTAEDEHIDESDYIGIAIDDSHLAFAQVVDGEITHQNLLPISYVCALQGHLGRTVRDLRSRGSGCRRSPAVGPTPIHPGPQDFFR